MEQTEHLFDLTYPHLDEWVNQQGFLYLSTENISFLQAFTGSSKLVWADFGQYERFDDALKACDQFLKDWKDPVEDPAPKSLSIFDLLDTGKWEMIQLGDARSKVLSQLGLPDELVALKSPDLTSVNDYQIWGYGDLYLHFSGDQIDALCFELGGLYDSKYHTKGQLKLQGFSGSDSDSLEEWLMELRSWGFDLKKDTQSQHPLYRFPTGVWLTGPVPHPDFQYIYGSADQNGKPMIGIGNWDFLFETSESLAPVPPLSLPPHFWDDSLFANAFPVCTRCLQDRFSVTVKSTFQGIRMHDRANSIFNHSLITEGGIGDHLASMEENSARFLPKRKALPEEVITLSSYVKTGQFGKLKIGMTKAEVLDTYGPPEEYHLPSDGWTFMDGDIWKYNEMEFYFRPNDSGEIMVDQISRSFLSSHFECWFRDPNPELTLSVRLDIGQGNKPPTLAHLLQLAQDWEMPVWLKTPLYISEQCGLVFESGVYFIFHEDNYNDEITYEWVMDRKQELKAAYMGVNTSSIHWPQDAHLITES